MDYYKDTKVLHCPSDRLPPANFGSNSGIAILEAPRSYIFNGFNDYFTNSAAPGASVLESVVQEPSETVLFGEKDSDSGHWYMDYTARDEEEELEQTRHLGRPGSDTGGSDYAFADGSARFLRAWHSLKPVNLWAVHPGYRKIL